MGLHPNPTFEAMGQGAIGLGRFRFEIAELKAKLQQWFEHRHPPGKHAAGDEIRPQKVQTPQACSTLQLQEMVTVVLQLQGDRHPRARRGQQAQIRVLLQLLHQTLEQGRGQQGVQQMLAPVLPIGKVR